MVPITLTVASTHLSLPPHRPLPPMLLRTPTRRRPQPPLGPRLTVATILAVPRPISSIRRLQRQVQEPRLPNSRPRIASWPCTGRCPPSLIRKCPSITVLLAECLAAPEVVICLVNTSNSSSSSRWEEGCMGWVSRLRLIFCTCFDLYLLFYIT